VRLARLIAGHGIRSVRLDLSGAGDSPARPGLDRDVVYPPEWLADLDEAVAALSPAPVVLVGLCSGAYSALECALSSRVHGVCVVNPILANERLAAPPLCDPRRRALRVMPASLRRLAAGHRRAAEAIWLLLRQVAVRRDPAHVLAAAVRRGTDVLVVSSTENARTFRGSLFWRVVGLPRLQRTGRLRIEVVDGLDHAADRARGREAAVRAIAAHVIERHVHPESGRVAAPRRRALRLTSLVSTAVKELG
jgi:pimeloyl-ACP methyl ester carboxylesterase